MGNETLEAITISWEFMEANKDRDDLCHMDLYEHVRDELYRRHGELKKSKWEELKLAYEYWKKEDESKAARIKELLDKENPEEQKEPRITYEDVYTILKFYEEDVRGSLNDSGAQRTMAECAELIHGFLS